MKTQGRAGEADDACAAPAIHVLPTVRASSKALSIVSVRFGRSAPSRLSRTLGVAIPFAAILLSACVPNAVIPNAHIDVPARYAYGGPDGELRDHAVDWWVNFRSGELNKFMDETEVANFSVGAAIGQLEQADAAARETGAALLPTLNASDTVTRAFSSGSSISTATSLGTSSGIGATSGASGTSTTGSSGGTTSTTSGGGTSSGLTGSNTGTSSTASTTSIVTNATPHTTLVSSFAASYQLDFWGKNRAAFKSAQDTATAARWNRQTVQLTELAATATTYYNVLASRERVAFAKQNIVASSRILKLIQDREKAGTATALQVAQQQALVSNLQASVPPLQVIADQNLTMLGILLGRAPQRVAVTGKSVLDAHVPRIAPGLPSEVLTQRPDVEFAEYNLSSAHANLVAARAAFFPTLNLTAQGGFESLALKTLFSPASTFYTVALGVAQPIFDGGLLRGQFDAVKGRQDELLADYKLAIVTAFSDVDKALVALKLYAEQEEFTRQSLAASTLAFKLSEDQLKQGVLDIVSLLQVEQTLFTTQDSLVQVRLLRLINAVALYQALGGAYAVKPRHVAMGARP